MSGLEESDVDLGRILPDTRQRESVEVVLHNAAGGLDVACPLTIACPFIFLAYTARLFPGRSVTSIAVRAGT
jgi:hypothetical protein